jgi:hypothetical protein
MPQALPLHEAGDLNMLDITEREYIQLTGFIKTNYGINLGEGKKALLLSRLQKVLAEQQLKASPSTTFSAARRYRQGAVHAWTRSPPITPILCVSLRIFPT